MVAARPFRIPSTPFSLGIPLATLGLAAWIAALVLTVWDSELARTLIVALALVAIAFAVYLVVLQLFVLDAVCIWCMINDVVLVPLLAVLAFVRLRRRRRRPTPA